MIIRKYGANLYARCVAVVKALGLYVAGRAIMPGISGLEMQKQRLYSINLNVNYSEVAYGYNTGKSY